MLNITITGATGRMGQALTRLVLQNPMVNLVGALVRPTNAYIGVDAGTFVGQNPCGVVFSDDIQHCFKNADVVIDFCPAGSTKTHLDMCEQTNTKLVLGTTGLDDTQESNIYNSVQNIAVVYASNFSIGVTVLLALTEKVSRRLDSRAFTTHIDETHHIHKLDAPSGTALSLGKTIAKARGLDFDSVYKYEHPRTHSDDITFSDTRRDEVIGEHTVHFDSAMESIALTHRANNRDVFAYGAIMSALWIMQHDNGLYSMRDVLEL